MFMVLSSWPKSLREFTQFIWWMQTEHRVATNPQTKPINLGCESAENWQLSSTIAIVIITQTVSWYSFYHPTKGGKLSWPKHCSKGAQPVLKTVYRSSCRDKHNCQQRDSNLDPLTPQSDALTTRLLRPAICWTWKLGSNSCHHRPPSLVCYTNRPFGHQSSCMKRLVKLFNHVAWLLINKATSYPDTVVGRSTVVWSQCLRWPGDREFLDLSDDDLCWECTVLSRLSLSLPGWSPYSANASNLCWVSAYSCSLARSLRPACRSLRLSLSLRSLLASLWPSLDDGWSVFSGVGEGAFKNWLNFVGCATSSSDEEST